MRIFRGVSLALAAVSVLTSTALAQDGNPASHICEPKKIIDADTGQLIRGAEDIAYDAYHGRIYLSAYDRWGVEKAQSEDAPTVPQGGIYLLTPSQIADAGPAKAVDLTKDFKKTRPFHPHGIGLRRDRDNKVALAVINRQFRGARRSEGAEDKKPVIDIFSVTGAGLSHRNRLRNTAFCRANDVAFLSPTSLLVTQDRSQCGGAGGWIEDVTGVEWGKVLQVNVVPGGDWPEVRTVLDDMAFPNGIEVDQSHRRVVIAATRDDSLRTYALEPLLKNDAVQPDQVIKLPGSPDNLSWTGEDRVLVAVHPSLIRLGLHLNQWFGGQDSPSRVVSVNLKTGKWHTVMYDTLGAFSAATAAVSVGNRIVVGSATAPGILVCTPRRGSIQAGR